MKISCIISFLIINIHAFSQISFEQVDHRPDFSTEIIIKSPYGEYFVQAEHDAYTFHSSTDLETWKRNYEKNRDDLGFWMEAIQYLNDGTPVIASSGNQRIIRRDNEWHKFGGSGQILLLTMIHCLF